MISMNEMLSDIRRALGEAMHAGRPLPLVLEEPLRMLSLLAKGEKTRIFSERRHRVPVPRVCIFSVTWKCNLSCAGCYAKRYTHGNEMTPEQIEKALRQARELGSYIFVIAGGEPLMVPGIIDILARQEQSYFLLFTNGTLLTAEHARRLSSARNILTIVSAEGASDMTDQRRGAGMGMTTWAAMNLLASENAAFGCSTMVTHQNLPLVTSRPWFDHLWNTGARLFFLIDYIPFPQDLNPALLLTPEDVASKTRLLEARYAEAKPLVVNFPSDEYFSGRCQAAGMGFLHVNADGYVEPCPFSHYACDNICEKPLAEILGSNFFRAVRKFACGAQNQHKECLLFKEEEHIKALAAATGAFCTENLAKRPLSERCPAAQEFAWAAQSADFLP